MSLSLVSPLFESSSTRIPYVLPRQEFSLFVKPAFVSSAIWIRSAILPSPLRPSIVFHPWSPLGRTIFFFLLLLSSPSPLALSLSRVKLKIVDRTGSSLSLFFPFFPFLLGSLVAAGLVDFRLKPEISSNIRAMEQLGSGGNSTIFV